MKLVLLASLSWLLVACGPNSRPDRGNGDDVDASDGSCSAPVAEATPETCSDGIDNDCDGVVDCADPDCSGVGACPVCGMAQHPLGQPLALPDGMGAGPPYTSKLHFDGFGPNQTFTDSSNLLSVCLTIEHTWLRDLQIELHAPSGQVVVLQQMLGQTGSEIYLGHANDCDTAEMPIPGVGAEYCWKPMTANPAMLTYANGAGTMMSAPSCNFPGATASELPPGDYSSAGPWQTLVGATMNGDWEIFVQDEWAEDNGFIFKWSIEFDPTIFHDCSGPIIQ